MKSLLIIGAGGHGQVVFEIAQSYLTLDWKIADFQRSDYKKFDCLPTKPNNFSKMRDFCLLLSKGMRFIRCDFYEINGKLYFSELTFFPNGGFNSFDEDNWDMIIGDMLKLE
jgi:hypothetical protein